MFPLSPFFSFFTTETRPNMRIEPFRRYSHCTFFFTSLLQFLFLFFFFFSRIIVPHPCLLHEDTIRKRSNITRTNKQTTQTALKKEKKTEVTNGIRARGLPCLQAKTFAEHRLPPSVFRRGVPSHRNQLVIETSRSRHTRAFRGQTPYNLCALQ